MMGAPPKAFISYSHDTVEHQERVLGLADRLRAGGIDAEVDQYNAAPPEGWPLWCERQIAAADVVLMVCTEAYHRRVSGDEERGKGLGVVWEAQIIRQLLYDAGAVSDKFVPVLFSDASPEQIPTPIKGWTRYVVDTEDGYEELYRRLTGQPRLLRPALGTIRPLPTRRRQWPEGTMETASSSSAPASAPAPDHAASVRGRGMLVRKLWPSAITILHVSDVHFGERDRQGQQPEICNRLLEKAHEQGGRAGFCPDLCIFSGDLTFHGGEEEFERGEDWLKRLIMPWPDCRVFVVPGNHEVVRPKGDEANETRVWLHGGNNSGLDEAEYNGRRRSISRGWENLLSTFRQWHENARGNQEQLPCLISNWSADLYGCWWEGLLNGLQLRVIGLNTALLSCEDNEQGKLVADMIFCNEALHNLTPENTLSLVVAHHPCIARDSATGRTEYWLVEWNRRELEKRLLQQTGAHLFLHGHVHNAQAESFSNSLGQHLVVLGAGATHQDPQYPLRFAFYRVNCNNQEIQPKTFLYSHFTGRWEPDEALSKPFRAILPRVGPRYPSSRHNDFDDFGYGILAALHEISKRLDLLSKEAYDLIYRPSKPSDFEIAFSVYLQAYSLYIEPHRESLSIKKDAMIKNIKDLDGQVRGVLADAGNSSIEHLSHLYSQFEQFNNSHNGILQYMKEYPSSQSLIDLYAKIKTTKAECDMAINHGISFTREFLSFRLRVLDH